MPNRNTIRTFQADETYHVYNRGVAKQAIFLDKQDYEAFMRRLQLLLLPEKEANNLQHSAQRIRIMNMYGELDLQAFCLMPNHFHLMLKQNNNPEAITHFMKTLTTSYSMYFNKKYERVGPVFQGKYKAATVDTDPYLLHLSRYIHCNPRAMVADIYAYPFSSLQYYFSNSCPDWLKPKEIEDLFGSSQEYQNFVNDLQDLQADEKEYDL